MFKFLKVALIVLILYVIYQFIEQNILQHNFYTKLILVVFIITSVLYLFRVIFKRR